MTHSTTASRLLIVGLLCAPALDAQVRDSVRPDSVRSDSIRAVSISGLTAIVARPASTAGGSSAVTLSLDSAVHVPAPTLEQVLRDVPFIQLRQNSRGEVQPALRGAEDRQVAVLMDGVPLTLGWDHRTDMSIIPLTAARSVTLIRGLSSVLHGPNVLGGVVEVDVSRGAERMERPDPLTFGLGVDDTGATNVSLSGGALFDRAGSQWVVRGGAGYQERSGVTLPGRIEREEGQRLRFLSDGGDLRLNSDSERIDGFLSARHQAENGRWLSFSGSGYRVERGVPPEAHIDDPRLWRYPHQSRLITALSAGTGQRDTAWGEGDLEISVGLDVGSTDIDQFGSEDFDVVTGGERSDDFTLTTRLLGDHTLGSGMLRGAFTYADVNHDEVLDPGGASSFRQRLWSLGSEVEWRFDGLFGIPGLGATTLNAGVALDGADTPESGDKPPLGTLWDWGGRVGVNSLHDGGRILVHAAVSRRTRFPALRELYSGALGRFLPNPDLRPELLTAGEVGATLHADNGEFQVVVFHQRLSDGIVRISVDTPEGPKFQRANRDEITSTGLELFAATSLGPLSLDGDLTLQRVRGSDGQRNDLRLEYEPSWSGSVGAGLLLPADVVATADFEFRGRQFCENPEMGGLEPFDASFSGDVGLRRRFRIGGGARFSRLEAFVGSDNVGDQVVFDQCGLPRAGRTFRFQIRVW